MDAVLHWRKQSPLKWVFVNARSPHGTHFVMPIHASPHGGYQGPCVWWWLLLVCGCLPCAVGVQGSTCDQGPPPRKVSFPDEEVQEEDALCQGSPRPLLGTLWYERPHQHLKLSSRKHDSPLTSNSPACSCSLFLTRLLSPDQDPGVIRDIPLTPTFDPSPDFTHCSFSASLYLCPFHSHQ